MLARRLLILAAVLLALGAVAASLAPRDLRGPQATTTVRTTPPAAAAPSVQGRDVNLAVDASAARPQTVSARVGDHVRLIVTASRPDAVSIPTLGQSQPVDPYTPAMFDLLPDLPGSFPVTLQQSGRRVATLRIGPAA